MIDADGAGKELFRPKIAACDPLKASKLPEGPYMLLGGAAELPLPGMNVPGNHSSQIKE